MELFRKLAWLVRAQNLTDFFVYSLNYTVIIYEAVQFNYNIKHTTMRTDIGWLLTFSRMRTWTSRAIVHTLTFISTDMQIHGT
jgi:hypothetical protein